MTQTTVHSYVQEFEDLLRTRGAEPAWLTPLRRAALSRFSELGFPQRNQEEWRFTDVRPIAEQTFLPAGAVTSVPDRLLECPLGALPFPRLVFVNGRFSPELSRCEGIPAPVRVGSLADALRVDPAPLERHLARYASFEQHPFVALNTACFADGGFVHIPRNTQVETPILLAFIAVPGVEPVVMHPRSLVLVEENAQCTLIEAYFTVPEAQGVYLTNAATEVMVADRAIVDHYKVAHEAHSAYHMHTLQVELQRSAQFSSHNLTFGSAIVRNDHNARFHAEDAECTLNGLYIARDNQLVDNHTAIDHAVPHCNSHELYKGILDGRGHGVFNGKIFVRKDAQKTDAKQTNQVLLLSPQATINTKPQLEIFADDVRCTHGATVGPLETESLFYLRSRGISQQEAQNILIRAFAEDIIDRIRPEALREAVHATLAAVLPQSAHTETIPFRPGTVQNS
ncbi:MAG: Fe-S cluster assembly protein SufD [Chloroherpetonaceae bacterium]|nr:Fe-S cluster assembly protein SufD [Chthonomonadaceae bacterium]MDW8208610.1 Fe-S cluster assembly protein SufD [Chloroherpetonaceae bacterium]